MGASFALPPSPSLPRGATIEVVRGAKRIRAALEAGGGRLADDVLGAYSTDDDALNKLMGARPRRVDDEEWRLRKRRKLVTRLSAQGSRRVALFARAGDGGYLGVCTAELGARSRTADAGVHFRAGAAAGPLRAVVGELLRRLRRETAATRVRSDVPPAFADVCASLGFRRLRSQDRPPLVRMTRDLDRWSAVGHVLCLAALCRSGRAAPRPDAGALGRVVSEVAGHDRDHWAFAFLRSAVAYL